MKVNESGYNILNPKLLKIHFDMAPPLNVIISCSNLARLNILSCFADFFPWLQNHPLAIHEPRYGACITEETHLSLNQSPFPTNNSIPLTLMRQNTRYSTYI